MKIPFIILPICLGLILGLIQPGISQDAQPQKLEISKESSRNNLIQ